MKRNTKRTGKGAMSDQVLAPGDAFPHEVEALEEHVHDLDHEGERLPHHGDEDEAEETAAADETAPAAAEGETEDSHSPDDALGLYLRQMGAIPLLNRDQEVALAKRLEMRRRRYRHAALASWRTL